MPDDPDGRGAVRRRAPGPRRRCGSSRVRPATGRRTARCGCGRTTTRCRCMRGTRPGARPPRVAAQHPRELIRTENEHVSGLFDDDTPDAGATRVPRRRSQQRSRALIGTIIVLVVAFFLVSVFTGVWTDRLWFQSVGYSERVHQGARHQGAAVPGLRPADGRRRGGQRRRRLPLPAAVPARLAGAGQPRPLPRGRRPAAQVAADRGRRACSACSPAAPASGQWRQFLLWRHGGSFGTKDPYFHKDIGFYVFDLPWLHYLVDFGMARDRAEPARRRGRALPVRRHPAAGQAGHGSPAPRRCRSPCWPGCFVLFKAADYWLDRYNLDQRQRRAVHRHRLHRPATPCCPPRRS